MPDPTRTPTPAIERLALRPREAAALLSVSERHLWSMTRAGRIPCVRAGRCTLYPVPALREWLAEQSTANTPEAEGGGE